MKNPLKAPNSSLGEIKRVPVHVYGHKAPSKPEGSKLGYQGINESSQLPENSEIKSLNQDHDYC